MYKPCMYVYVCLFICRGNIFLANTQRVNIYKFAYQHKNVQKKNTNRHCCHHHSSTFLPCKNIKTTHNTTTHAIHFKLSLTMVTLFILISNPTNKQQNILYHQTSHLQTLVSNTIIDQQFPNTQPRFNLFLSTNIICLCFHVSIYYCM